MSRRSPPRFVHSQQRAAPPLRPSPITSPANGADFTAPATITLAADAADQDGSVAKVEFFNGTDKIGEDTTAPFEFHWSGVEAGSYTILATATDNEGHSTTSNPVALTVTSVPVLPVVTIAATDATGGEFGADNSLAFTITRTGDLSEALLVGYTLGGTATKGADYSDLLRRDHHPGELRLGCDQCERPR